MKQILTAILLFISITFEAISLCAQERDTLVFYFKQGSAEFEPNFKNNSFTLDNFSNQFKNTLYNIDISATSSPEGTSALNHNLSYERSKTIANIFKERKLGNIIKINSEVTDWNYLKELIKDSNISNKEDAIRIIDTMPELKVINGVTYDYRRLGLKKLNGGKVWSELLEKIFPQLRRVVVLVTHIPDVEVSVKEEKDSVKIVPIFIEPQIIVQKQYQEQIKDYHHIYMSLSTNMIYDFMVIPNIGFDFYLDKNFSIAGNWHYTWIINHPKHLWWQSYGGDIELRYWMRSKKPLTGFHVAPYLQMITYDVEFGGVGYQAAKYNYGGGFAFGYTHEVSNHFNIDFNLGLGYLHNKYTKYVPHKEWYMSKGDYLLQYFGPTKFEISLVWWLDFAIEKKKKDDKK